MDAFHTAFSLLTPTAPVHAAAVRGPPHPHVRPGPRSARTSTWTKSSSRPARPGSSPWRSLTAARARSPRSRRCPVTRTPMRLSRRAQLVLDALADLRVPPPV